MKSAPIRFSAVVATVLLAACALYQSSALAAPVKVEHGMLVGSNDMTLYVFDKDAGGKSACNGPCAANWPPLLATASDKASGEYGIISRDDGQKQWTLKGKPLYFWSKDKKPGDKSGDGFNHIWHVARP